jgi:hypothetical protein
LLRRRHDLLLPDVLADHEQQVVRGELLAQVEVPLHALDVKPADAGE